MRCCRKTEPSAKIKDRQYHLRRMLPDEQTAILKFANDSIRGNCLNLLYLRHFDAKPKRADAENGNFLNIQSIHRKKQAQRRGFWRCARIA
ncbi:hypothetical protein U14_05199 [Candidatus Moduliflexus flocculans]|uniref:Uncharacterized protein n=1 Tax=Candidatus Moduliflexus flocculans TaxID=1499966 RepID=A0A081BR93_9BACT|nr:hypothetical protein U14_05199 [Candidatus Moduliflexus flocculans]